jgi:amino acid transporter
MASPQTLEPTQQGFRKRLTLSDVIAQSLSVMALAMSGAFLTYLAATKAGGATPLAYVLGTFGILMIGLTVAQFARDYPSAGGLYTYITVGANRHTGFVAGWTYAAAFLILGGAVLCGFGFFTSLLLQGLTDGGTTVTWYWFSAVGLVFIAVMSMFDVQLSTRTQLLFAGLTVVGMVVTALVVIGRGSPSVSVLDGTTPVQGAGSSFDLAAFLPGEAGVTWVAVLFGLNFAILSFTGAEACAVLAEETKDPLRNIPRAVIGSIVIGGLFYALITYATSIGFGVQQAKTDWPASVAGLAAVAPNQSLANVVLASAAVASLFCALGVHTAVSRILFAMGRERVLPGWLGQLHPRFNTPWNAIAVDLVCWVVFCTLVVAVTSRETKVALTAVDDANTDGVYAFTFLATLGTPLVMLVYLLVGVSGVLHGRRTGRRSLVVTGALASVVGALAVFGGLYYSFVEAAPGAGVPYVYAIVPWVCLAIVAVGFAVAAWTRSSRPVVWDDMGRIFADG